MMNLHNRSSVIVTLVQLSTLDDSAARSGLIDRNAEAVNEMSLVAEHSPRSITPLFLGLVSEIDLTLLQPYRL